MKYNHRLNEQIRFANLFDINVLYDEYKNEDYQNAIKGEENLGERSHRCYDCYKLRLEKTAIKAKKLGFDYFTTTLSISPLKNAEKINEIGEELAEIYKVPHLPSDFKKKNGYKRSIELSHEFDLYRQNYCGCVFSRQQAEKEGRNNCEKPE